MYVLSNDITQDKYSSYDVLLSTVGYIFRLVKVNSK